MHILCGEEEYKSYVWDTWKGGKRVIWVPQDQWLLCSGESSKLREKLHYFFSGPHSLSAALTQAAPPHLLPLCRTGEPSMPHMAARPYAAIPALLLHWAPSAFATTLPPVQRPRACWSWPGYTEEFLHSSRKRQNLGTYSITLTKCQEVLVQSRSVLPYTHPWKLIWNLKMWKKYHKADNRHET